MHINPARIEVTPKVTSTKSVLCKHSDVLALGPSRPRISCSCGCVLETVLLLGDPITQGAEAGIY